MKYITDCNNTVNIGGSGPLKTKSKIRRFFVMPDFQAINRGYVKPEGESIRQGEQVILFGIDFCFFAFVSPDLCVKGADAGK